MFFKHLRHIITLLVVCTALSASLAVSASAADFQDIPAGHWAAAEIQSCVENGFFKGQSATHFGLGQSMTRSSFAVVLCRFFGWEPTTPLTPTYSDVPTDAWYAGAVEAAYHHGALTAQQDVFRPADPITREELTVMLVRALGYTTLAGLSQDLPHPFEDADANAGYIALAYQLGLMNGTSTTTFSPDRVASREQVAVILMRLYKKLSAPAPSRTAIVTAADPMPDLNNCDAIAIPAYKLIHTGTPKLNAIMETEAVEAIKAAAKQTGVQTLLHITSSVSAFKSSASETAKFIASAVEADGYDGLILDIPQLKESKASSLSLLTSALRQALGTKTLHIVAEAPAWNGTGYAGYQYAALAEKANQVIIRIAPYQKSAGALSVSPVDPLEEVYFALSTLNASVPAEKLSLFLTTEGSFWRGRTHTGTLTGSEIQKLLDGGTMESRYSARYACAYLTRIDNDKSSESVWYLNRQAAEERTQLLRLFGNSAVCLSNLNAASGDLLVGLQ